MTTEPARRRDSPAQLAKIATAGATGMFVFGLTAVMGWADRPTGEPGGLPAVPVPTLSPTTTTMTPPTAPATVAPPPTLVPLSATIAPAPTPTPVAPPAPPVVVTAAPAPPLPAPPAPVVVVSEQSQ